MSRPELVDYIRGFSINCKRPRTLDIDCIAWRWNEPEYTAKDMMRAKALIKSLDFDKVENWMVDLKWRKIDVFLGLLFSTLTNLRRLHLSIKYHYVCQVQFSQSLGRPVAKTSLCALEIAEFGGRGTLCEYFRDHEHQLHWQLAMDIQEGVV